MNLEPVSYAARCPACGKDRQQPLLETMAATMDRCPDDPARLAMRCEPCLEAAEGARKQTDQTGSRATADEARRLRWEAACPYNFRTAAEGGPTDEALLASGRLTDSTGGPVSYASLLELARSERTLRPIIFLAGAPGSRKTRIGWRMARAAFDVPGSVPLRPWGAFFTSWGFQTAVQEAAGVFRAGELLRELVASRIVVLDDLGKTEWTNNTASAFFELLDQRAANNHATVITANMAGQALKDWFQSAKSTVLAAAAEPILRRIREHGRVVVCQ